ncbi:MAG: FkbM family methyltransferase [Bdellovibrionales bacterium]
MSATQHMVAAIVRNLLGDAPLTSQEILAVATALGRSRGDHRAMTMFCDHFLKAVRNCNYNSEENGERMVLRRLAAFRPKIVFDVGANEGEWSRLALAEMPGIALHAFEIIPETFRILQQKMAGEEGIRLGNFGLSDRNGEVEMHVYASSSTISSHVPYPHDGDCRTVACPVRTGDGYMRENGIERIDFLKLDVEGAESDVLQGFSAALSEGCVDVVQFEYGKINIMTRFLLCDFYRFFEERDYAVGKIYPDFVDFRPYDLDDEDFLGPNYIACRRLRADIREALGQRQAG